MDYHVDFLQCLITVVKPLLAVLHLKFILDPFHLGALATALNWSYLQYGRHDEEDLHKQENV